MRAEIEFLYGKDRADAVQADIESLISTYSRQGTERHCPREHDAVLITYPDQIRDGQRPHLDVLRAFLKTHCPEAFSSIHLLPFYPYTSDDGFSVTDYKAVADGLGDWPAVDRLAEDYSLMFDAVINHISASSAWVQGDLNGDPDYAGFCMSASPDDDLSTVTRPRTSPLLTAFDAHDGKRWLWTTFSADQVDLDYSNPKVLIAILDVLLFYISHGARYIRLDAIAYLWKIIGTTCIHLPQTHAVVRLMRAVLDKAAPATVIITETNVPHSENISYFGNGRNEAQMVYQFSLPPLTAQALLREDAGYFNAWADALDLPGGEATFFNFTASHDGIGVRPLEGLVPPEEISFLAEAAQRAGGHVSSKTNPDGSTSPYELNVNYCSLLQGDDGLGRERFLVSQAVMLAMPGVPGIYVHSLLGSQNYPEGVAATGRARSINREKLQLQTLDNELQSKRKELFSRYVHMLTVRRSQPGFNPLYPFIIRDFGSGIIAIERQTTAGEPLLLALHNVTSQMMAVSLDEPFNRADDSLQRYLPDDSGTIQLPPFGFCWLTV